MNAPGPRLFVVLAVAALAVGGAVFGAGWIDHGSLSPSVPRGDAPPWPLFDGAPSVYDSAAGVDLWFIAGAASWTYNGAGWSNITATAGTPSHMGENARMAFDASDGYVLLYGGETGGPDPQPLTDSWAFQDGRWTNITASVTGAPSPRLLGVMAYDTTDREVVLFGGTLAGTTTFVNETWTYAAGHWSNLSIGAPPPLPGAAFLPTAVLGLVDDPAAGYLLYYDPLASCFPNCAAVWTFAHGAWTNLSGADEEEPTIELFAALTYDSTAGAPIALAGCSSNAGYTCAKPYGTFAFRNGSWSPVNARPEPAARYSGGSVDDPMDGGVMVVAGCCWADFSGLSGPWQDVLVFDHGGWSERTPWGGGGPGILTNDGSWLAIAMLGAAVAAIVALAVAPRRPPPPEG